MDKTALYALSFFTNAIILIFEIAGGRLLAPYIGTTVGVWAGLIAVVLGAMAFGYHYGGKLGDRDSSRSRMGLLILLSGIAALLAWGARDLVPGMFAHLGYYSPTVGALVIGTILFLPTVILLAMVSPMIAKNLIQRLDDSAKTVGELNAVGTAGSIVGAVATGMFLIPRFGVDVILFGVAISILAVALLLMRKDVLKISVFLIAVAAVSLLLNASPTRADGWIADITTPYNRVVLTEGYAHDDRTLALWTSPFGLQCQMYVTEEGEADEARLVDNYQQSHDMAIRALFPEDSVRALFLGGCIFAFPRYFLTHYPASSADVVEIDPGMTDVAKKYFGYTPEAFPNMAIINDDARMYVNRDHTPYDLVYLDAFGSGGRVPFHLITSEMFERLGKHVNENGILLLNVHGAYAGEGVTYPAVYVKTTRTAFSNVALYQYTGVPEVNQNLVLMATHGRELPDEFTNPLYPGLSLKKVDTPDSVIILTDNYAPVEGMAREKLRTK